MFANWLREMVHFTGMFHQHKFPSNTIFLGLRFSKMIVVGLACTMNADRLFSSDHTAISSEVWLCKCQIISVTLQNWLFFVVICCNYVSLSSPFISCQSSTTLSKVAILDSYERTVYHFHTIFCHIHSHSVARMCRTFKSKTCVFFKKNL